MKTRRSSSLLTALALVLSLLAFLPAGAFRADAYTGAGSETSPYIVSGYTELRSLIRSSSESMYIKLSADLTSNDTGSLHYFDVADDESADRVVHIDLAGHKLERTATTTDTEMFRITNSTLVIDDSVGGGKISSSIALEGQTGTGCRIFQVDANSRLIINKGTFKSDNNKIINNKGTTIINDGTFTGKNSYVIYSDGTLDINGGKYSTEAAIIYAVSGSGTVIADGKFTYNGNGQNISGILSITGDLKVLAGNFHAANGSFKWGINIDNISTSSTIYIDAAQTNRYDYKSKCKDLVISCKNAKSAVLSVTKPKHGAKQTKASVTDSEGITLNTVSTEWFDLTTGSQLYTENTFIGGHTYRMTALLTAAGGYVIGKLPEVIVNYDVDPHPVVERQASELYCKVTVDYVCPKVTVSDVDVIITEPKVGNYMSRIMISITPGVTLYSGALSDDTRNKGIWYQDAEVMSAGDKFELGASCTARFNLRPVEGYEFTKNITVKVNGSREATEYLKYSAYRVYEVTYVMPGTMVTLDTVEFEVTEPKAGEHISDAIEATTGIEVISMKWLDRDHVAMQDGSVFVAGREYTVSIKFNTKNGYEFGSPLCVKINGKTVGAISTDQSGNNSVTWTYTLASVLKGDVDGNGKVNMRDYALMQKHLLKPGSVEINMTNSDMDGDGKLSMRDYALLQKLLLKQSK
ncbi:MAG: hypothetical protein IKN17_03435 [Ruminococcus sp.]|nr:hypothetical protein [Ruminococcus sp.]